MTLMLVEVIKNPLIAAAFVAAPFLYLLLMAFGRWLKRRHGVLLGFSYQLLCLSVALYVPLKTLHQTEHPGGGFGNSAWLWHDYAIYHFGWAIVLLGILFALSLLRRFYWQRWFLHRHNAEAPKFLQQIFGVIAFCVTCTLILKIGYNVQVDALVAGSGIVAIVIGFAMQDTLANIISGVALQIGKPFKVGDWLIVEHNRAEVVEVNWRSTRLRTNDDIYLDIPNKTIVGSTITNLSYPTKVHANRIKVGFEYSAPPNQVRDVLQRATASATGVLKQPPPKVFVKDYTEVAINYEIKYSLDDEARFNDIEDSIKTNIWYEAKRAGLSAPFSVRTLNIQHPEPVKAVTAADSVRDIFARQELFTHLTSAQKEQLLGKVTTLNFGRGEQVIKQGAEGNSMFIILKGEADVFITANDQATKVATLKSGDAFGEMSLLTDETRSASVYAKCDCEVWEIRRGMIQQLLKENSELAEKMSALLAQRKLETEGVLSASAPAHDDARKTEYTAGFMRKISALFEL